ncbi:MAG: cadmium-translocating P-type ATPase [Phyllobacteriaceae bacterium]|nr:cadmium-translocating P-type ATPase [Phyllobacteriaceae bacterium]
MSCCAPGAESALEAVSGAAPHAEEIIATSRDLGDGLRQIDLAVPGVHCGACIATIEGALNRMDGVEQARVNLSTKRVSVRWREQDGLPPVFETLAANGYQAHLFDFAADEGDHELKRLLLALAVAGFAAANIMLLSVSVWSGAEDATRDLFHWISAFIAIPALVFSGRIFYVSAWSVLKKGRTNMDVPISIGVSLAYAMSLYETWNHGHHAYFDAAVTLLFFLLIGRTLDHLMRERARSAVKGLARMAARGAFVERDNGEREWLALGAIEPGMRLHVAAGERIPVDGRVDSGASDLDCSVVSGESAPVSAGPGSELRAGSMNLTGPLTLVATAKAENSFLAEMVRLMEAAESGRARYRRIADRAAQFYAPAVHLTAFLSFLGWMAVSGDWHHALTIAVAVLIITCPCALGLAVPIVQVVAARRLFDAGVMVRDGAAFERMAEATTAVFDKTGTLTLGRPELLRDGEIDPAALAVAAALARQSRHPLSQALAAAADPAPLNIASIAETPGQGIVADADGHVWRLGRRDWAAPGAEAPSAGALSEAVLSRDGELVAAYSFRDRLRPDARAAIVELAEAGFGAEILSGDTAGAVAETARRLGVSAWRARLLPGQKVDRIDELARAGARVLMVGDGVNDAPSLAAAHVSIAPATAADIGRNAADFVFLRDSLAAVPLALEVSRQAGRLIRENFALAILYNLIAVPLAILGYVTPLVAALAMSGSSVLVVANAMRLNAVRKARAPKFKASLNLEPAE